MILLYGNNIYTHAHAHTPTSTKDYAPSIFINIDLELFDSNIINSITE